MTIASSEERWDVLVVGAGPAGATAARCAALDGARVLLADRAAFPRRKTCAGGIIGAARQRITPEAEAVIERTIEKVGFSRHGGHVTTYQATSPFLAMVQRDRFDQANVEAAKAAGAVFRDRTLITHLTENDDDVVVEFANGERISARVVIGADGCGGRVGRYVGARMEQVDLGLEVEVPRRKEDSDAVLLDWGPRAGGYAWSFPKAETLTIGVVEARGVGAQTREYLQNWLMRLGLDPSKYRAVGHLTQWRRPGSPLRRGRVLLAGETAGLLEPWTREGISFALRSGEWAGEAAAAHIRGGYTSFDVYERRVRAELLPEISAGRELLRLHVRHPILFHLVVSMTPTGRAAFVGFCRGETTLSRLLQKWWLRLMSPRVLQRFIERIST